MKNSTQKTGPRVKAMYIAAIDEYEAKKESILAKYLQANEKVKKAAYKSVETSSHDSDERRAEASLKAL